MRDASNLTSELPILAKVAGGTVKHSLLRLQGSASLHLEFQKLSLQPLRDRYPPLLDIHVLVRCHHDLLILKINVFPPQMFRDTE